jgi:hypothetical protein
MRKPSLKTKYGQPCMLLGARRHVGAGFSEARSLDLEFLAQTMHLPVGDETAGGRRQAMDNSASGNSSLYLFEKFEVGVIHLDAQRKVQAMNDFARKVLPVDQKQPFDRLVTSFHPERSQPKVGFLLDQASACPVANATPMTMIINIPEQVLLIKVTRLGDADNRTTGFVLVFYDVTQVVSQAPEPAAAPAKSVRLGRIPVVSHQQLLFVDAEDVLCLESQAHYTRVLTREGYHFCNLSIGDLQARLDPSHFMRVHRCFIVNLRAVSGLGREGSKTTVLLKGGREAIPVSRKELASLREILGLSSRS